jgi:hypothetical protein
MYIDNGNEIAFKRAEKRHNNWSDSPKLRRKPFECDHFQKAQNVSRSERLFQGETFAAVWLGEGKNRNCSPHSKKTFFGI